MGSDTSPEGTRAGTSLTAAFFTFLSLRISDASKIVDGEVPLLKSGNAVFRKCLFLHVGNIDMMIGSSHY